MTSSATATPFTSSSSQLSRPDVAAAYADGQYGWGLYGLSAPEVESTYGDGRYGYGAYGPTFGVVSEATSILVAAFSGEVIA